MQTTANKENATPSSPAKPFFSKKGDGGFFAQTKEAEQPFFAPNISRQGGAVSGPNFANIPIFPPRSQHSIQPKLTINEPGDKYEQEADAITDQVMRMSTPVGAGGNESMVQAKPLNITAIQRKCAACEDEEKVQRQEIEKAEPLQTKPLMRKSTEGGYTASPQLSSQINSSKGGGDPLSGKTLASMNQAFGADFSTVRVHTGSQAAEMSKDLNAQAFTVGKDIYFNEGKFAPESGEGKRLLAHELTHTVQQGSTGKIQRAQPEDVKITGKHAKASQYTDSVFFDQNGTILDAAETKKIEDYCHALVKGGTTRIKIIGYSSEEGSDSQNKVYISARLDSVDAIIKAAEPGLTVERESNVNKGTGEIDYRFWRMVRIVKGVTTVDKVTGKAVESYDISEAEASHKIPTSTEEDCELNHKAEYKKHWSISLTLAENRIDKTILELTTNYATTKPSVKLLFNDDSPEMQKKLVGNLGKIKTQLSNYTPKANHVCATSINSGCDKSTAYNVLSGKSAKMTLCDTFWGDTPDEQADTLIHEAVHGTTDIQGKDHSYGHVRMIAALSTKDALNNPDSYAYLIKRAYSSTAPVGKNPADTFTGMTSDEEKKVQVTLANLEVWLVNAYQISSQAYSDFHAGGGGISNWVRWKASSDFGLTPYPSAISEGDKIRMAAIHDRYLTMRSLFMGSQWGPVTKTGPLSITKSSNFSWAAGPGLSAEVNDDFFKKNAYDRVRALMLELLKATPGISSGLQWAYVQLADDIRFHVRKISNPTD